MTICTENRRCILSEVVGDGFPVPSPIGVLAERNIFEIPEKYPGITVDHYVIMPDHIHLLLRMDRFDGEESYAPWLGKVIGWFKYQVTKQANLMCNTSGKKIFQRSYYDHVIRNQRDYDEIWEYIEYNPRKWVMKKQGGN